MVKHLLFFYLFYFSVGNAQSAWPSVSWSAATNLTSVMDPNGLLELSGLHWNPETNRLYVVHGNGRLRVLQLNTTTNTFSQMANKSIDEGPEGITQVNLAADEFYTIDENNYEIRKFTHTPTFSTITQSKHWNLLTSPSPMLNTGNTGPEGIAFIPDAALATAGFVSQETGNLYTSVKGMGGLLFVAHQDGGYIWVFDVNPDVSNDFIYVGKYRTNRSESCDLSFDRSTGILYILHNTGGNFIEATDLSSTIISGTTRKFTVTNEYFVGNPTGNSNIEGFAMTPKCPNTNAVSAFLCRDVENNESATYKQDCLRWFTPFVADGNCNPLAVDAFSEKKFVVYPSPAQNQIYISGKEFNEATIRMSNHLGQIVLQKTHVNGGILTLNIAHLQSGLYVLQISQGQSLSQIKWLKE